MLVAGLVLTALAAVAAGVAYRQRREHGGIAGVEGSTCGHLRQREPERGSLRVSTRSEEKLTQNAAGWHKWIAGAAVALAAAGLVLVVVGLAV